MCVYTCSCMTDAQVSVFVQTNLHILWEHLLKELGISLTREHIFERKMQIATGCHCSSLPAILSITAEQF